MAKFIEGQKKPEGSGRKKGSANRKTQHLEDILNFAGFSVPEKIIELMPQLAPEKQADILMNLMGYLYPKRKAIEQTNVNTTPDFESMSDDDLQKAKDILFKRHHGFDSEDREKRKTLLERHLRLIQLAEKTKNVNHTIPPKA